jgi:hypothetical protein
MQASCGLGGAKPTSPGGAKPTRGCKTHITSPPRSMFTPTRLSGVRLWRLCSQVSSVSCTLANRPPQSLPGGREDAAIKLAKIEEELGDLETKHGEADKAVRGPGCQPLVREALFCLPSAQCKRSCLGSACSAMGGQVRPLLQRRQPQGASLRRLPAQANRTTSTLLAIGYVILFTQVRPHWSAAPCQLTTCPATATARMGACHGTCVCVRALVCAAV